MAEREKLDGRSLKKLLKAAVEAVAPDLRQSMKQSRRARITAVKPSAGGSYVCSVQAVLNDGRPDPAAPVIPDVEIPVMWAGPNRGVVCPPTVGEFCDIGFYDGDANSPFITNFRPNGQAPEAEEGAFMIQHGAGVRFGFKPDGTFVVQAPKVEVTAPEVTFTGNLKINGNLSVQGNINATGSITDSGGNTNHHSHG